MKLDEPMNAAPSLSIPISNSTEPKVVRWASASERVLARAFFRNDYRVRLAASQADIYAAQTLRFLVFNVELNEGLEQSYDTLRDADPFDSVCDHLLVEETHTGEIVGTYRLQTGTVAAANLGFYSAQEFNLEPFALVRDQVVEAGRACVHSQHRNLTVLGLLWKGVVHYARERGGRYLIGCSSDSSTDPAVGASIFHSLQGQHLIEPSLRTVPHSACACALDHPLNESPQIPKLLTAYFSLGAKICGPPAIDREFKTIDFLTVLDLDTLSPTIRHLLCA